MTRLQDAVPLGLVRDEGAGVAFVSARHVGSANESQASPELVALFSEAGHERRSLMVARIDSADAPRTLQDMTSLWDDWLTDVRNYRRLGAKPEIIQVAWAEPDLVVWVVATGLSSVELEGFLDSVHVD
jgi:hypothetical protein